MSARKTSIFKDQNVSKHLSHLHNKYVLPTHKASNNTVFVCKSHCTIIPIVVLISVTGHC